MAEDGPRIGGLSSGLAVVLNGQDRGKGSQNNHFFSYCDDFGDQSVERTLEHIFHLPYKTINPLTSPIDVSVVRSIIKNDFIKHHADKGVASVVGDGCGPSFVVSVDESSICGDIRIVNPPFLLESQAMFSSARANYCVWKGKWMYEVILETSGVQQIGWATLSCPFTDHKGVGDADDSYAYDGKRVSKWSKEAEPYGQPWVAGDVIGCCIDMEHDEISFYRNGYSLGVAFNGIRKMVPGLGYYPAISLSQGERCELNFGGRPFIHPIEGFLPLQMPPPTSYVASGLLHCLKKLLEMNRVGGTEIKSVEKLRILKRFQPLEKLFDPVSNGICEEIFQSLEAELRSKEYIAWGPLLTVLMGVFGAYPPHDYTGLDRVIDLLSPHERWKPMWEHLLNALSCRCKTASLVLTECPYSGSYPYLAMLCHLLRREEFMLLWWKSSNFEFLFEGFLSRKSPNKQDLQRLIPSVWWPGSSEDMSNESSMALTTTALSDAIYKIEEKHRDLCLLVMQFIPPTTPPQLPGSVFRTFLQNLVFKNRGADRNLPPPGVSSNCVLVSLFTVILHFLSEGFSMGDISGPLKGCWSNTGLDVGFLHRGGQQSFPASLFVKDDPHRVEISRLGGSFSHLVRVHPVSDNQEAEIIRWEEGCTEEEETQVTHSSRLKPCCCSSYDGDLSRNSKRPVRYMGKGSQENCSSVTGRSTHVAAECSTSNLNDEITDKHSMSGQSETEFGFRPVQQLRPIEMSSSMSSTALEEEELLDAMLHLYHLGLAPNFKQASSYMSHQSQSITLLEETDQQVRERVCGEQFKRLKEARSVYREEVIDCVRHCAWYRVSLLSRWKQRGMYAACMWIVQFLLVVSKLDSIFLYIPEFYLETLVDCFHVLRKGDPPFVPAAIFLNQGLTSFVTFVVTHFNDSRISSVELRDLLLQSISVLVQYKEYLAVFEINEAAMKKMPRALLSAFDNRSWIPVTTILLRLCKGSGFVSSKYGESSSSSIVFQRLLRQACIQDEELFSAFLNRLFNTLSWAITEFSVSVQELREKYKVSEFQQRKCTVIFDLSCNLARVLEFCAREIPQAFLFGADTNLQRLTELIVFILNHITSAEDPEIFEMSLRRHGQSAEKTNQGMILAPLAGIILNLLDASVGLECCEQNDIVEVFASMDCTDTVLCGIQYLSKYNWDGSSRGDASHSKLRQLEHFSTLLISRAESMALEKTLFEGEADASNSLCCICYANDVDSQFVPCTHISCFGCISRHLLNCERCFFCNAAVVEVIKIGSATS